MITEQPRAQRRAIERRMFARYELNGDIRCELDIAGSLFPFLVDDISLTGMRLRSPEARLYRLIRVGEGIRIQAASDEDARFLRGVQAQVIWSAGSEDWVVIGVAFAGPLSMTPEVLGFLQRNKTSMRSFDQPGSGAEH
jgi:c-di-GMP-binding flagellar brake protein YcgR